jgi:DNA polymerase III sliding clamp (beta) subunit (PCNA family)
MAKKETGKVMDKGIIVPLATAELKSLCDKVSKGVKNNKVMDITSLLLITVKSNVLTLTSTDGTTNVEVKQEKEKVNCPDFEILVKADSFIKLVSKTTADKIVLTITPATDEGENANLQVKGNGTYNFETVTLPEGDQFPSFNFDCKEPTKVKRAILNKAIHNNKPATSNDSTTQLVLTGIYFSDKVISSDSEKAAATDANVFKRDVLLRPEAVDLLSILTGDELSVSFNEDRLIITDGNNTIYTAEMQNKEDYPLDVIRSFIYDGDFPNTCKVNRDALLGCLDRLSVFTDVYSSNGVELTFDKGSVTVTNAKSKNATEEIDYELMDKDKECKPFSCSIEADMLKTQIQITSDVVALSYGNDTALQIRSTTPIKSKPDKTTGKQDVIGYTVDDDVTLLVAFLEEEQA